jgi:hypothetical protein
MTKTSAEGKNGSRYAAGGIAKLNWINGAAYIIEAVEPIVLGGVGRSNVILTKDRPGWVKRHCSKIAREPRMMYAGTLVVKSTGDGKDNWSLRVDVKWPPSGSDAPNMNGKARTSRVSKDQPIDNEVPVEVLEKVLDLYVKFGSQGASVRKIEEAFKGNHGTGHVRKAIKILYTNGCLAKGSPSRTSNMSQLRYEKDWDSKTMNGGKE